jgi:hypothetical protein
MSLWLLDTDHVSLLLERHPQVSRKVARKYQFLPKCDRRTFTSFDFAASCFAAQKNRKIFSTLRKNGLLRAHIF